MSEIRHIDDVLPWIDGRKDFVVKRASDYIAVDYAVALHDTFSDERRMELRGVKFFPDGRIMARPLHKFFNVGERVETQVSSLDFDGNYWITDKLDGSMVHPAMLADCSLVFMTRMGVTDVAKKAWRHASDRLLDVCRELLVLRGITPIFEFTAPDNRIVVKYPRSELTLLTMRDTITGQYATRAQVVGAAEAMGVSAVREWARPGSGAELIEAVRALKDAEGVVIRFANGQWVKIKGEEYALMHRAKDSITREKNVLACLLDGLGDDLRPLLIEEDRVKFDEYADRLGRAVVACAGRVSAVVESGKHLDQKTFATEHLASEPQWLRPIAFQLRAGRDEPIKLVQLNWRKFCGSQTDVDSLRPLLGFTWDGPIMESMP